MQYLRYFYYFSYHVVKNTACVSILEVIFRKRKRAKKPHKTKNCCVTDFLGGDKMHTLLLTLDRELKTDQSTNTIKV